MCNAARAEKTRFYVAYSVEHYTRGYFMSCSSESFDVVASRYSAHHWSNVPAGLTQMHRVSKPGGLAVFMDVISPGVPLLDTWLQTLELLRDPSHVRNFSQVEWQNMLGSAGFVVCTATTFRLRLEFSSWIERMKTAAAHVAAIRSLQQRAGAEVTEHFAIEADGSFTVDTMLITAQAGN
ncbi:class I SAM-dependent methyltransferase [Extensimonas sp. H3M7-6]|nr:class I SAM-dependent methyltransferase [Extensimonas sp. H3M7-6]MDF1480542.1 class I SAM-dependent methyltransferase [Extensimonas sp. H3M7-6]